MRKNKRIPEGWRHTELGDISNIHRGLSWSKAQETAEPEQGAVPVLRIPNIQSQLELDDIKYIRNVPKSQINKRLASKGWSIMVGSNGNPDRVGNCIFMDEETDFLFASFLLGLESKNSEEVHPDFLFRVLSGPIIQESISRSVQGSTGLKNISLRTLRSESVLLPPLPEQRKIAEILSSVDEAIQATQETIEQTKRVKKGLLQDLMPNDQDCKLHYERVLLDHVATRGTGHTPNKKKSEYWNGGVKWVSLSDSPALDNVYIYETQKEISKIGLQNSSAVLHPAGTVVLSRDAGVGKSAILGKDMAVSQHFVVWRCGPEISRLYLYYWLQSKKKNFERIAVGSTIKTIGMPYFRKLSIPLPPLEEQIHTAQILHQSDKVITSLEVVKKHYVIAKNGLMQDLLTGEVRVC